MFGSFALSSRSSRRTNRRRFASLWSGLFAVMGLTLATPDWGYAQSPKKKAAPARPAAPGVRGLIIVPEGTIFDTPSFDGQVIGSVAGGQVFEISRGKKGVFYRIRVKPGVLGWISDAEVKPVSSQQVRQLEEKKKAAAEAPTPPPFQSEEKAQKPLEERRYRGLVFHNVQFTEKTMGKTRRDSLAFYGFKFSGPNTVFEGPIDTDGEMIFHSGAPGYYEEATGQPAGGFIFIGNFLFQTHLPQSRNLMLFYGFGPMFRFSHFEATLRDDPEPGKKRTYNMDDMAAGAIFNFGSVLALGSYALRIEGRYYWETQQYTSFALALQKEF